MTSLRVRAYSNQSHWRRYLSQVLPSEEPSEKDINVGQRLQALRQARGLSQRALAEMSGLNFNTLSLIENEKSSPNVSTLQQLADALNVPVTAFFEVETEQASVVFQQAGDRPCINFSQGIFEDLGGGLALGEGTPLLMTLRSKQESGDSPIVHTGTEFVYCLSGELVFWVDEEEYFLCPGDSLIFEAHIPHRWANMSDSTSRALVVICPADQDDRLVTQHLDEGLGSKHSQY